MAQDTVLEGRQVRLKLPGKLKGFLMRAQVDEGLSRLTETTIEFMSPDIDLDLQKLVGERLPLEIDSPKDKTRYFQGRCTAAEYLGSHAGRGYFRATVRPWLSVRRPSSKSCSRMLNTSRWAFSTSSSRMTQ